MPAKRPRPPSKTSAPTVAAEAEPAPPSVLQQRFEALGRSPLGYVLASIVALLPCYWGTHIQAGDLSSHIYNSWLAQLVEAGKLSGLVVTSQATNVLFDLILTGLFRSVGPDLAQRFAVSVAVLIFVWGAFAFASAASGKRAWPVLPCIIMLAYGYVFHMGFFDFYLSLGLCFCGLAMAWNPTAKRLALAAPFFVLAFVAHALAFAWGAAFLAYLVAANYLGPQRRMQLTLAGLAGLIAARVAVSSAWPTRWAADQITLITGADQLRVFDDKYYVLFFALLAVWAMLLFHLIRNQAASPLHLRLPLQLCILSAAGVFLLPGAIQIPGYRHALVFIAERMSLGAAVCLCALLASAKFGRLQHWSMAAVTAVFFLFLFHDERAFNAFENRIGQVVATLPPGQRVLLGLDDDSLTRVNAITHMIDRECIGRCYSYANYEPSTWQFRIRAMAPNPYVASDYRDSYMMQSGQYVVKPSDLPLYQVTMDDGGNVQIISLPAGAPSGLKLCRVLPGLL
ncbi:MAG: hypothetical protein WBY44_13150 [Bryobacteraceae bacterium]|jgi:hypothetical protein